MTSDLAPVDCPCGQGVCVRGTGPGFGEGGGWWSLSCLIATLTLCSPRPPPGKEERSEAQAGLRGWSCKVGEEGSVVSDAKLLAHNSNNILRGAGTWMRGFWLRARAELGSPGAVCRLLNPLWSPC